MRGLTLGIFVLVGVALFLLSQALYVVPQTRQAIVLQLGRSVDVRNAEGEDEAGLQVKLPFIQTVVMLDKRNLGLESPDIEILAADQQRLVVDAFVRWRISNPLTFYQRLRGEEQAKVQLNRFTESAIREALGRVPSSEIVSGQRAALMAEIRNAVNAAMAANGVQIIDVRIRRTDLPQENLERVFERMRTARQQDAQRTRSEGEEAARRIRSEADREVTVILAEANRESQEIRGDGDGQRAAIYADAYQRDAEFFSFFRSMLAYEQAISAGTPIVLSPDSEFFRYFGNASGNGN
jgi:membrane protease subunit HflC